MAKFKSFNPSNLNPQGFKKRFPQKQHKIVFTKAPGMLGGTSNTSGPWSSVPMDKNGRWKKSKR